MQQIVINGNNLELLKKYPDNHFDAVVTDPPYGLGKEPNAVELMKDWVEHGYHEIKGSGFMGKEWDAFVPQPLFWKEVFRVLKHGGHVLAFYGTRTFDWGVMAMRFAGFEVRDSIYWHYGSGFPKSHNISKAIDKLYGAERKVVGISNNGMKTSKLGSYNFNGRDIINGVSMSNKINLTNATTKDAKEWDGWGSALKPASEPIVLARKPLEKGLSIAENVLKWGTGGINIDGCRVGTHEKISNHSRSADSSLSKGKYGDSKEQETHQTEGQKLGRFPANIIMTHHPECECKGTKKVGNGKEGGYNYEGNIYDVDGFVSKNSPYANSNYGIETIEDWNCHPDCPIRIMDEQSGISKTGDIKPYQQKNTDSYSGSMPKLRDVNFKGDTGGASRFFYVAKASKSERNKGLEEFESKQSVGGGGGVGDYLEDVNSASGKYGSEKAPNKNFHPTVKPVKLMQYLVRLITPPNGLVLDPFCGSGTTGIACKLEGFDFVGMEQDPEYTKIAQARINNWVEEKENVKTKTKDKEKDSNLTQTSLF